MSGAPVVVFAFDPVEEMGNARGLLVMSAELAGRLIAEHRVEKPGPHANDALRYVEGAPAFDAARQALRDARTAPSESRPRKVARLER